MSSIPEITAATLSIIAVILTARKIIWCWPVWIVATALYAWIFFESKLYADAELQIVFLALEIWAWREWSNASQEQKDILPVNLTRNEWILSLSFIAAFTGIHGFTLQKFTDASFPWLDSLLAGASLAGTWMQGKQKIENWLVFIVADVLYVSMYSFKNLYVTAGLYVVFLGMAVYGYVSWKKDRGGQAPN